MRPFKFIVALLFLVAVGASFFGVPFAYFATWYQAGPALVAIFSSEPYAWVPAAVLLVVTLLFGRFFCEAMCPLGLLQTLVHFVCHPKTHVRRVCTRLPQTGRQHLVRWLIVLVAFVPVPCLTYQLVEPYAIFGRALTLFVPGFVVLAIVLALAAVGRGRVWCNWICPVGTVISAVARFAPWGNRVGNGCARCRACLEASKCDAGTKEAKAGVERREVLKGVVAVAVAEKVTDGGFAPVSLPTRPDARRVVLPPGFGSRTAFGRKCIACGLCMRACPEKILRPSARLMSLGQPELDFRYGHCLPSCVRCGTVCPTDAIAPLQADTKAYCHIGHAVWKRDLCLRTTAKENCTACIRKCPTRAIHLVEGFPVVDKAQCVGCGACEHVCPVRPETAIFVKGFDEQRMVRPMNEEDLFQEMRGLVESGVSVVVARDGVIVAQESGRGIAPLLTLLDAGKLARGQVCDKVVGRAAAAICVKGGVRRVHACLMSADAAAYLTAQGIRHSADKIVANILNRAQTDRCPLERSVEGKTDVDEMLLAIRQKLEQLRKAVEK